MKRDITEPSASPSPGTLHRRWETIERNDIFALGTLVLAAAVIPLSLATAAGAIGLPSNDDWVYTRAALNLYDTGSVEMVGHTTAFIGQLALVQPFLWLSRGDPWAFTAFGLVMASIAIASTYLLARRYVAMGSAVLVVLLVLAFPGFVRESASFMTDVPAFALVMLCMLLGTRWLQGDGGRATLVASLGVGLLAVSIREFAIAAPVAVLTAAWARNRAHERIWLAGSSLILALGVVGVLVAAGSVSGKGLPSSARVDRLLDIGSEFTTLAAVLLAATLLYVGRRIRTLGPGQIIIGAALASVALIGPHGPLVGNQWTAAGLGGNQVLAGVRDPVFGTIAWALSRQLALFAAIVAAAVAVSWGHRNLVGVTTLSTAWARGIRIAGSGQGLLVLFLIGYAVELVLYAYVGFLFDRFLFPMVPVAAILLLRGILRPLVPGRSRVFAHGALVWLVVTAFVISANSFAYDTARYREGEAAVAMGYDATTVDAGYEWVGAHGSGLKTTIDPHRVNWWDDIWTSFHPCALLTNSAKDVPGYRLIRVNRSAYKQLLFFGPAQPLYLYGALTHGCPAPPQAVDALRPPAGAADTLP